MLISQAMNGVMNEVRLQFYRWRQCFVDYCHTNCATAVFSVIKSGPIFWWIIASRLMHICADTVVIINMSAVQGTMRMNLTKHLAPWLSEMWWSDWQILGTWSVAGVEVIHKITGVFCCCCLCINYICSMFFVSFLSPAQFRWTVQF